MAEEIGIYFKTWLLAGPARTVEGDTAGPNYTTLVGMVPGASLSPFGA